MLILPILAVPIALTVSLIMAGRHPDLYYVTPESVQADARALSWQTLDRLMSALETPPELEVEVVGYMIPAERFPPGNRRVVRFLLVPSIGTHGPHVEDPSEVIDVRMTEGKSTPLLLWVAVVVRGSLSFHTMEGRRRDAAYYMNAASVQPR